MYQLTCPFCQHHMQSPVVRADAIATCQRCRKKFRVRAWHYKELITIATSDRADEKGSVHVKVEAASGRAGGRKSSGHSRVAVLTPEEPDPLERHVEQRASHRLRPVVPRSAVAMPYPEPASARAAMARAMAVRQTRRRRLSTMIGLTVVTIVLSVVVVLSIEFGAEIGPKIGSYYRPDNTASREATSEPSGLDQAVSSGDRPVAMATTESMPSIDHAAVIAAPTPDADSSEPSTMDLFIDHGLTGPGHEVIKATAQPMVISAWQQVSEPFLAPLHMGPVRLMDDRVETADEGAAVYTAQLVSQGPAPVRWAMVELELVNFAEQVIAKQKHVFGGMIQGRPQEVRVSIPPDLAQQVVRVSWQVSRLAVASDAVELDDLLIQVTGEAEDTVIRLIAHNRSGRTFKDAEFYVSALDGQGRRYAQWRLYVTDSIQAGRQADVLAALRLDPQWDVRGWDFVGLGYTAEQDLRSDPAAFGRTDDPSIEG